MPKIKTHKGLKKVLNIRQSGSISIYKPGQRHNTGKKSMKYNRRKINGNALSKADTNRLKNAIK